MNVLCFADNLVVDLFIYFGDFVVEKVFKDNAM